VSEYSTRGGTSGKVSRGDSQHSTGIDERVLDSAFTDSGVMDQRVTITKVLEQYIEENIDPSQEPRVYDTSNDVVAALNGGQIDGIVVDLPTAFYLTGSGEVKNGTVVGQFPSTGGQEHFGMLFEEGNPLRDCVDEALAALKEDGTLEEIQQQWLSEKTSAPVLE